MVNGKDVDFSGGTLFDLIMNYGLNPDIVAVEKNSMITHRQAYREEMIHEGDRIEIVTFVGGG